MFTGAEWIRHLFSLWGLFPSAAVVVMVVVGTQDWISEENFPCVPVQITLFKVGAVNSDPGVRFSPITSRYSCQWRHLVSTGYGLFSPYVENELFQGDLIYLNLNALFAGYFTRAGANKQLIKMIDPHIHRTYPWSRVSLGVSAGVQKTVNMWILTWLFIDCVNGY